MIDTLKFAKHMQAKGGMSKEQAEALAEGINEAALEQLVTKQDLKLAVSEIKNYALGVSVAAVGLIVTAQHLWK